MRPDHDYCHAINYRERLLFFFHIGKYRLTFNKLLLPESRADGTSINANSSIDPIAINIAPAGKFANMFMIYSPEWQTAPFLPKPFSVSYDTTDNTRKQCRMSRR